MFVYRVSVVFEIVSAFLFRKQSFRFEQKLLQGRNIADFHFS